MRLATFTHEGRTRIGVALDREICDIAAADRGLPDEMSALLALGQDGLRAACRTAARAPRLPLAEVRWKRPCPGQASSWRWA